MLEYILHKILIVSYLLRKDMIATLRIFYIQLGMMKIRKGLSVYDYCFALKVENNRKELNLELELDLELVYLLEYMACKQPLCLRHTVYLLYN